MVDNNTIQYCNYISSRSKSRSEYVEKKSRVLYAQKHYFFFYYAICNSACIMSFTNFARTKIDRIDSVPMLSFVVHCFWLIPHLLKRYGKVVPPPTTTPMSLLERIMPYPEIPWLWKVNLLQLRNLALIITFHILFCVFQLYILISLMIEMLKLLYL